MKNMKNFKKLAFSAILLIFIFVTALINISLILKPTKELVSGNIDFPQYVSNVKTAYTSDFNAKDSYINLNGLFAKVTGRKVYNETATIKNGMLINGNIVELDMKAMADGITDFNKYLKDTGRKYLYVQLPYKMDMENTLLPNGVDNYANSNADQVLNYLNDANVPTLDLRPYITADAKSVEKNFFRTDHHWNSYGAFKAFNVLTSHLSDTLDESFTTDFIDINNWESHTLEDWFLGSLGKRVGVHYAGVDDFTYLTPNFDTKISKYVSNHRAFYKGDFTAANLDLKYLDGTDYFGDNVYCLYIGGDYQLVKHRNALAPSKAKILLIKDSFSLPLQSFLSTVFSEVDVLDPRYFKECNIAEYVELSNPDIVISLTNPSVFQSADYRTFETEKARSMFSKKQREFIIDNKDITIPLADKTHNYICAAKSLEYGTQYTLTLKDIKVLKGETDGVTVALYNKDTGTILSSHAFDIEYCRSKNEFEWSFLTPQSGEGELRLLLYSGIHGKTENKELLWQEIDLVKHY